MIKKQFIVFLLTLFLVLGLATVDRVCGRIYGNQAFSETAQETVKDTVIKGFETYRSEK